LQNATAKHCSDPQLGSDGSKIQVQDAGCGLIHSHAGTGTYITVNILETPEHMARREKGGAR